MDIAKKFYSMRKVLCIDDDRDFTELVSTILQPEGYQVVTDTGKLMHHILRDEKDFGLVLIDENLKWMWGSDLCLELKQSDDINHIPVLMISGAEDIVKIKERCGAEAYLRKPFDVDTLVAMVSKLYCKSNNRKIHGKKSRNVTREIASKGY